MSLSSLDTFVSDQDVINFVQKEWGFPYVDDALIKSIQVFKLSKPSWAPVVEDSALLVEMSQLTDELANVSASEVGKVLNQAVDNNDLNAFFWWTTALSRQVNKLY